MTIKFHKCVSLKNKSAGYKKSSPGFDVYFKINNTHHFVWLTLTGFNYCNI